MSPFDHQTEQLTIEDEASITDLYPGSRRQDLGWIAGRVVNDRGLGQPNVAVIVVDSNGGRRHSAITRAPLSQDAPIALADVDGRFRVPVPPGSYSLHIEPISDDFRIAADLGPSPLHPQFQAVDVAPPLRVVAGSTVQAGDNIRIIPSR